VVQAVSRYPIITEIRVQSKVSQSGICCEQNVIGTCYSRVLRLSHVSNIPDILHTHLFIRYQRCEILEISSVVE
jgi:hypothetical protein